MRQARFATPMVPFLPPPPSPLLFSLSLLLSSLSLSLCPRLFWSCLRSRAFVPLLSLFRLSSSPSWRLWLVLWTLGFGKLPIWMIRERKKKRKERRKEIIITSWYFLYLTGHCSNTLYISGVRFSSSGCIIINNN